MVKKKNKKEEYEERIRKIEAKIKELEKEEKEPSIVEDVVGQFIPGLGGIIKTLEKTSPEFRKRIAETDAEIKHRLETGWTSKPKIEYRSFAKPITRAREEFKPERIEKKPKEVKPEISEREPIVDVFETEKYISVIAELPGIEKKDIEVKVTDDILEISAGKYSKKLKLPCAVKNVIIEKTYKHGILELKLEK